MRLALIGASVFYLLGFKLVGNLEKHPVMTPKTEIVPAATSSPAADQPAQAEKISPEKVQQVPEKKDSLCVGTEASAKKKQPARS